MRIISQSGLLDAPYELLAISPYSKNMATIIGTFPGNDLGKGDISRFRKRQEFILELSEYTVGSLRKLRGKRNASTETGICAKLVNTVLPVQEVVATISYIPETSVDAIRKCATSMRKESENET